jgi:tRNA (guanine-N7-)-methyltransferase
MGRKKQINFEKNRRNPKVIEPGKDEFLSIRGKWNATFFENSSPIVLEIGCGRGEYTVGLAKRYPQVNFIGVDIKGSRLWKGASQALEENLNNVAFVRNKVENLQQQFAENEVSEIWITFPDPRPKERDEAKRLTSLRFLRLYSLMAHQHGLKAHLKTDDLGLYEYSLGLFRELNLQIEFFTDDLYRSTNAEELLNIQTTYEKRYLSINKPIKYIQFLIPAASVPHHPLFQQLDFPPIKRELKERKAFTG